MCMMLKNSIKLSSNADIEDLSDVPFPPGEYEIEVAIGSAEDVLASYLMVPGAGEWNIFYGATVPSGAPH